MRVCAVHLPDLRIELLAEARSLEGTASPEGLPGLPPDPRENTPLAVVVAPLPLTEQKLLGSTRLSVVSREARVLGIQPGQTIAQARARAVDLAVRVVRPDAVRDVLACLAEVGLAFGATVSFDTADADSGWGDVVWIDVTGCAHLHVAAGATASVFDGETILASRLAGVISALGYTCSIAIADGPRIAAMLARAVSEATVAADTQNRRRATARRGRADGKIPVAEPFVVRPGENATAIGSLPICALPLPPEDVRWLAKLGVRTIEEMRRLPREGIGTRLGGRAREVMSLVDGDDRAPLAPYVPPEIPEEDAELEYGVEGAPALTFVTKALCDRLAVRLQGRAVATARVELALRLDEALLSEKREPVARVTLDLPSPLSDATDLLAALRPKLERLTLEAPVLGAKLRAPTLVPRRAAALSLFEPQPKAERALPRLVAELASDLGADAVSTLVLGDGWTPEERSKLVPFSAAQARGRKRSVTAARRLLSSVPEPSRLLAAPLPVARESVRLLRHLSRHEAVGWWKQAPTARQHRHPVDNVQAWTEGGVAWIEIDRAGGGGGPMRIRGWFD